MGAILAGGTSRRFGSDKALVLHEGRPLIGHVVDGLMVQCDELVVCGRDWGGHQGLVDVPGQGLGPMGGLAAALAYAEARGFDDVISAPCDLLGIPDDCAVRLSPGPAVADGQWLLGLWPAGCAAALAKLLAEEGAVSARRWAAVAGAAVRQIDGLRNINRPEQLIR